MLIQLLQFCEQLKHFPVEESAYIPEGQTLGQDVWLLTSNQPDAQLWQMLLGHNLQFVVEQATHWFIELE
jgi:hypothetical protein